jgi:predicted nucleic acid-binding OB-fold protein
MARHRMYDVNSATAIHLELLADIPRKLADKIVAYRKKRKRIFYIDELYRVRGRRRSNVAMVLLMGDVKGSNPIFKLWLVWGFIMQLKSNSL